MPAFSKTALSVAALALASSAHAATYYLNDNLTGNNFFNGFDFYSGVDTNTTGNVFYQTKQFATSNQLAYINNAGRAVIAVDSTTSGVGNSTFGRNSVKMLSQQTISAGSLVVMDAVHMPFGCSVWPAYWMQGINDWPTDGEIDIMENVNLATNNRMTLHTTNGCMHPAAAASTSLETGSVISTDCFNATNGDEGCIVEDQSTKSYGAGFAQNGGGAFAMLWDSDGIKIWFFPRGSMPSDITSENPNPANWPTPTAFWPESSCNTQQFFRPQTIIFDTTICGNFAGAPGVFNAGGLCPGTCTDYVAYPGNYTNAYFEVNYLAIYTNSSSASSHNGGSNSNSSNNGSGSSGGNSAALSLRGTGVVGAVSAAAAMIMAAVLL